MRETDQLPLRGHLGLPPEREAPEAPPGLDLAEDRFDDRLARGVERLAGASGGGGALPAGAGPPCVCRSGGTYRSMPCRVVPVTFVALK